MVRRETRSSVRVKRNRADRQSRVSIGESHSPVRVASMTPHVGSKPRSILSQVSHAVANSESSSSKTLTKDSERFQNNNEVLNTMSSSDRRTRNH